MKTLLILTALLTSTGRTFASAEAAEPFPPSPTGEFKPFILPVRPGASPAEVRKVLGAPAATLGADLWIYWNFGAPNPNRHNPAFDTLVIAFASDQVIATKITDSRVVRRVLAEAQRTTVVAAAKTAPTGRR